MATMLVQNMFSAGCKYASESNIVLSMTRKRPAISEPASTAKGDTRRTTMLIMNEYIQPKVMSVNAR